MRYHHVAIEGLVTEVPHTVITTDSLERMMGRTYQRLGLQPGFLELLTGIRARRFWDAGVQPSDAATIAARKVLAESSVNPDDIGILGLNDMEISSWENIALTTIQQPTRQIVASSIELIVAMLEEPDRYPEVRLFPCTLVERKTLRPALD